MKRESYRLTVRVAAAIRAVLMLIAAALLPLSAATITVSNTDDSGAGSLRQAIADAVSGDVIEFDSGVTGTIILTSGQLTINKSLTINGPGADVLAISGNNTSRVIQISSGNFTVTISGLTIRDGFISASVAEGGGINNQSTGTVTLNSCHILYNTVHGTGSSSLTARGGGINNRPGSNGRMILNNCLVEGNMTRATTSVVISTGGGILNVSFGSQPSHLEVYNSLITGNFASTTHNGANCWGGGLATNGNNSTTIVNSTISGNSSLDNGGGIYGGGISLNSVTITGNTASASGGGFAGGAITASKNSIIAGNSASSGPDVSGTLNSQGYNLIGNSSGATIAGDLTGNIVDVSAGLDTLADNGGPTRTHALLPGSPALNAGSCDPAVTTDQRGFSRPQGGQCDIGAFENQAPLAICQDVTVTADGSCTAAASVDNGSNDLDGDFVTVVQDPPGPYAIGTTTVTLTVKDDKGDSTQCSAIVTVLDNIAPVIACPADITVAAAPGACDAVVNFDVTAADCDPNVTIVSTPPSGSAFPVGITDVTCIATDGAGNADTCTFAITVTGGSGTIAGTVTENGIGAASVTVNLLDGQNPMNVIDSRNTDSGGNYDFTDIALATYQVMVDVPAGYTIDQNNVVSELTTCGGVNEVHFVLTPTSSSGIISGTVTVGVNPLAGVKVALLDTMGVQVPGFDTLTTNSAGEYLFNDVPPDTYLVRLIEPLGYTASPNPVIDTLGSGETDVVDFVLEQTVIANNSKPVVWWEVQFLLNLLHACNPEESEADLLNYIGLVQQHYTPHFDIFEDDLTLNDWWEKLRVWNNLTTYKRARRQLAGLLMNLVSGRIGQYSVVSADGRTAGEVLTYVSQLLTDGSHANDLTAELLAGQVNLRRTIAAGKVPPSNILYKGGDGPIDWGFGENLPEEFALEQNYPNPFNPSTTIRFALPAAGQVSLKIYNARGQLVRTLVSGNYESGVHEIRWDARNDLGETVSSGMYFYRMQAGNFVESRKMVLLR